MNKDIEHLEKEIASLKHFFNERINKIKDILRKIKFTENRNI
jgi:hypothetical protein